MKSVEECIAMSMDCNSVELIPYLPYILNDFHEIGSHAKSINKIIGQNKQKDKIDVLDLGCGKGAVLCYIAKNNDSTCLGIDAVSDFINYAKNYKEQMGIMNCNFIVGDVRNTENITGLYDFIIMGSIGPVFENYTIAMNQLKTKLKKNGIIILDDGYIEGEKKHHISLNKEVLFSQIKKAGMLIEREYTGEEICKEDEFESQLKNIIKRCNELIEMYPEKKRLFVEYIREQENEYNNLETEITCSTMIIRKMA